MSSLISHPSVNHYPDIPSTPIRSLQSLSTYDPNDPILLRYSDLCVLESAEGFYIGTTFTEPDGTIEPGSRDTTYFRSLEHAQDALNYLEILAASAAAAKYPADIWLWEMKFTHEFKYSVIYRMSP